VSDAQQRPEFVWDVPDIGFECTRNRNDRHWLLVQADHDQMELDADGRPTGPCQETMPLIEDLDLYLRFATLDPQRAAINKFANQFGLLVGDKVHTIDGTSPPGDRVLLWKNEIGDMKDCIDLWEAVHTRNHPKLIEHIGEPNTKSKRSGQIENIKLALGLIRHACNERLSQHIEFRLLDNPAEALPSASDDQPPIMGRPEYRSMPKNFLGALWLQLAEAIGRGVEFRPCTDCERWIEISGDARSRRTNFCGTACKSRYFRAKKRRARELHADGVSVKEIARELRAKVDRVEVWIEGEGRIRNR
jgi:hypothetical protein